MHGWIGSHFLEIILVFSMILSWLWLLHFRKRLSINGRTALALAVLHTVLGVLCVKAFAFLEGVPGGMSLYGAVFFLPVFYLLGAKWSKRPLQEVFDIFTICIVLTLALARVNCLHGGCCLGAVIPGTAALRWPTREAELLLYVCLAVWLGRKVLQQKSRGCIYPIYMMTYGLFRFFIEFLRDNPPIWGPIHLSHIWSVVSIAAGGCAYRMVSRRLGGGADRKSKNKRRR